jgi:hypothetical protein
LCGYYARRRQGKLFIWLNLIESVRGKKGVVLQLKVGICTAKFRYYSKMGRYTILMSDMQKLYEIADNRVMPIMKYAKDMRMSNDKIFVS